MAVNDDAAVQQRLTADFKRYIANRMLLRFKERKDLTQETLILDPGVFDELLNEALVDAVQERLIEEPLQFGCRLALMMDDDFFEQVRWMAS